MTSEAKIILSDLNFSYFGAPVLKGISADFNENAVTAVTGPSGQGKSTFLTVLNRLWQEIPGAEVSGSVRIRLGNGWKDIHSADMDVPMLRRKVGMVFQSPNPLPMSIEKNILFPLKLAGMNRTDRLEERMETALKRSFLWDEVSDRLRQDARTLSGGQQQRLCIARALVLEPEILLLDEPTSSLDDTAGRKIESLLSSLKQTCTLIMVSHFKDQVKRIADEVFELRQGSLAPSLQD